MSKIETENLDEDFSLPRTIKTHCNEEIEINFFSETDEDPVQGSIGDKLYNIEQLRKIQAILNEYL